MSGDFPTVLEAVEVFEANRKSYLACLDRCQSAVPPQPMSLDVTRSLFASGQLVSIAYAAPANWPDGMSGRPRYPYPPNLAQIIANFSGYLVAGKLPAPIADLLRRGAPADGPDEVRDQGWAVAYCALAKAGLINDRKPVATVAEALGIERRTVQRWKKEQASKGITWRSIVGTKISDEDAATLVAAKLREAGPHYLKFGRLATSRKRSANRSR